MNKWSQWRPFPNPKKGGYLTAPFGPGVYELRMKGTVQLVLYGSGKNLANRMTSLLPLPLGAGNRRNEAKRDFVLEYLEVIEYRTLACRTEKQANAEENRLRAKKHLYLFPT